MAKIVIADDDMEVQELIKFALENDGHAVTAVSDGEAAVSTVKAEMPDVVLLDVLMPKLSGFEVCEQLRSDPVTCLIPIILLTSLIQPKDRITGIKLGADEYLTKPFEPLELSARIEAILRRVRMDASLDPLTRLPGSIQIQGEIDRRLRENSPFSIVYMDVDNFKAYNDANGFDRGDEVIRYLAVLIRSEIGNVGGEGIFIGHIGGDDFVMIAPEEKGGDLAKRIVGSFNSVILKHYDEETRKRGYMLAADDTGKQTAVPLMSVSAGVSVINPGACKHHSEVLDTVKQVWQKAKTQTGNSYLS